MKEIREKYPDKTIWLYTGDVWENLYRDSIMKYVDVCVDGEFEIAKKDVRLMWKGSSNQRVIDVQASLKQENPAVPVLHCPGLCGRRGISERSDRMRRIARFMKVSRAHSADFMDAFPACGQEQIAQIYDALKLARATGGSAGYDFYAYADRTEA